MAVIYTGKDLGWAAGENRSAEMKSTINGLSSGDVFVFEAQYINTERKIDIPAGVTLAGSVDGAGLDTINSDDTSAPVFRMGNGTIQDLTFNHSNAPNTTPENPGDVTPGIDYHPLRLFDISSASNTVVKNCRFLGNIGRFLNYAGCDNVVLEDCEIRGGYWAVSTGGLCRNLIVRRCLFHQSRGDGIKTINGADRSQSTINPIVEDCVFMHNYRDGVDTTGGFLNGIVRRCIFVGMMSKACDFKEGYDPSSGPAYTGGDWVTGESANSRVSVENCEFYEPGDSCVVLTTLDRYYDQTGTPALTDQNADQWIIQDLSVTNCHQENDNLGGGDNALIRNNSSGRTSWSGITTFGPTKPVDLNQAYTYNKPIIAEQTGPNPVPLGASTQQSDAYYLGLYGPDFSNLEYGSPVPPLFSGSVTIAFSETP
jgi:hypothetical protein